MFGLVGTNDDDSAERAADGPNVSSVDDDAPLSLRRITNAFAALMGRSAKGEVGKSAPRTPVEAGPSPRAIVEALLFVGTPDDKPIAADKLAATMRDVSVEEVATLVAELNDQYEADGSAFSIVSSAAGYRLALRSEYETVRQKYLGRAKATTLSPAALEVLAVVAYRQPVESATIDRLRDTRSHSLLAQLVRRGLVVREKQSGSLPKTEYRTSQRFLTLFGIDDVDQLPRAEEFDLPDLPPDSEVDDTPGQGAKTDPTAA